MIDIHCHILPGLDDGAKNINVATEMGEAAIADGITHVIATPHASAEYKFDPPRILAELTELQTRFAGRLTLASGCDFHLNLENVRDFHLEPAKYTLNQKNYLLVEFSEFSIPPSTEDVLHGIRLAGVFPIVTHPERNRLILARPELLTRWMRLGCYVQITAQSVLGKFGAKAKAAAEKWLDQDRVHFIASDAHNADRRPLKLRAAFDAVTQRRGEKIGQALFRDNPLAALEGRPLPHQPEIPPESSQNAYRKRKRFGIF
jgi:protein-tyrosine phosphatase